MLWAGVEVLQVAVIALLIINQRKLQRRLAEGEYFSTARPPRSITEENS